MKKRHSIRILLAAAALLLATAACTKDELADGDRLPEGQYPLEIARITHASGQRYVGLTA